MGERDLPLIIQTGAYMKMTDAIRHFEQSQVSLPYLRRLTSLGMGNNKDARAFMACLIRDAMEGALADEIARAEARGREAERTRIVALIEKEADRG